MARSKVVIEDSFAAIFRDMQRINQDGAEVVKEEFAVAIGNIIDDTPQTTGQAASGWKNGADAVGAKHQAIKQGEKIHRRKDGQIDKSKTRSAKNGEALGSYDEITTGKTGKKLTTIRFEASNKDKAALAMEYGHGNFRRDRIVRRQIVGMKQRIGPHFATAFRATVRKPKQKKKTVVVA